MRNLGCQTALTRALRALVPLALLGFAGCGFHLQGAGTLPAGMAKAYIETKRPYSEFSRTLTEVLRQRGAEVLGSPGAGAAVIGVTIDNTGQRVLSVSARNIPREYEVYYTVTFSVDIGGEQLIQNESLAVTRSYTFDETQVLAKAAEEQVLREALAEDLARRVMRRIESIGKTPSAPSS
jgi:LPS-assembly lipoprotein